jgi:alpha,alpha-trehalase
MVDAYVQVTGNVSILDRALPIMETELEWWRRNRTISVKSPYTNKTHSVARYAVNNTAARPEVGARLLLGHFWCRH